MSVSVIRYSSLIFCRLQAYYVYIHPFLPIMPPPLSVKSRDKPIPINLGSLAGDFVSQDYLPHWPTTSLTLAISAILSLIPLPQSPESFADSHVSTSHSQAQIFADAAFDEVHNEIERATRTNYETSVRFGEHVISNRLSRLYPIMALSLLSVYEYCQRGSISRMRSCANQAVAAAMDFSLHSLNETSTEAERRAWWGAVSLLAHFVLLHVLIWFQMLILYLSSIDQHAVSAIEFTMPSLFMLTTIPSHRSFRLLIRG